MLIVCLEMCCIFLCKAVVQREGNTLKVSLKGIESVTKLEGDTIVNVSVVLLCNSKSACHILNIGLPFSDDDTW